MKTTRFGIRVAAATLWSVGACTRSDSVEPEVPSPAAREAAGPATSAREELLDFLVQDIATPEPWDSVVAEDLDGDGTADLVGAGAHTPNVYVVRGDSQIADLQCETAFDERSIDPAFGPVGSHDDRLQDDHVPPLSVVDMNGDGHRDVVYVFDRPTRLRVLTSDASGTLGGVQEASDLPEITGMVAADLDGDGDGDIICGTAATYAATLVAVETVGGRLGPGRLVSSLDLPVGERSSKPRSLHVADANGDGRPDILGVDGDNSLAFSFVQDTAGGIAGAWTDMKYGFQEALCFKDVDGDGLRDVVSVMWGACNVGIVSGVTGATVHHVDGQPEATPDSDPAALEPSPFSIDALDVDGDGRLELVLPYFERNAVGILFLDADMKLRRSAYVPVCQHPWAVTTGDLDGDGRAEIAVTSVDTAHVSIVRLRPSGR